MRTKRDQATGVAGGPRVPALRLATVLGGLAALFYVGGAPIMFGT